MRNLFVALIVMFALGACATSSGQKVDKEIASKFMNGKTTYAEVVKVLGKPSSSSQNPDGSRMLIYTEQHSKSSGIEYVPVVGLFAPPVKTGMDQVTFTFDKNLVLTGQSRQEMGDSSEDMAK